MSAAPQLRSLLDSLLADEAKALPEAVAALVSAARGLTSSSSSSTDNSNNNNTNSSSTSGALSLAESQAVADVIWWKGVEVRLAEYTATY